MASQTGPAIPPRPTKSPTEKNTATETPKIPPRPARRIERSASPLSPNYAPSPLNEPPNSSNMSRTPSNDLLPRPSSVTIPSLGEEGIEYQDLDVGHHTSDNHPAPAETRNVASDLKLHAPRPSLPTSSAKAKVQAVTRTDSSQAAAAGFGAIGTPAQDEQPERPTRSISSAQGGSRGVSSAASFDRSRSIRDEEHGIPEIGQRVPMDPNAGDVQAPSPSPFVEQPSPRSGRGHHRSRSSREASLPPGSYGLHGHGVPTNDKFEKAWYEKHPEEYAKEGQGQYGPGVGTPRPDWALSSDDLNKIVRGSAVTGSGLGTSPGIIGTPDEEMGYIASEEYSHRLSSPGLESERDSRPIVESSLRNASVPTTETQEQEQERGKSEGPGVIHIDEPYHHLHHPDGFAQTPGPDELTRGSEGDEDRNEPILATDEVCPESAYQQPAVSPAFGRRESDEYERESQTPSVNESRSNSKTASRRSSTPVLARYNSREEREDIHTPLEDVEEYEPLFPEDDLKENRPLSAAERFKTRPDLLKHRFPSQDIWEDSPSSLQLHATVSTPDIPKPSRLETPEHEETPKEVAQRILRSEVQDEKLPARRETAKQRFPSRDIWEDVPESQKLVTTIEPSAEQPTSPDVTSKPVVPPRPEKRLPPQVDASTKPPSTIEKRQPPVIPDRPKPQIPARSSNRISRADSEEARGATAKPKPAVPARPAGNKIAALRAGFLSDLNSRLQLGPQAPPKPQEKKEETPAEKVPLSDARKGRARGPARRKPAISNPSAGQPTSPAIKITETWNVWQIREDGNLVVGDGDGDKGDQGDQINKVISEPSVSDTPMALPLAKSVSGDSVEPQTPPHKEEDPQPASSGIDAEATEPTSVREELPSDVLDAESVDKPVDLSSGIPDQVDKVAESLATAADDKMASDSD